VKQGEKGLQTEHEKDLVFVTSGGRTGTQFFGDRLCEVIEGSFSEHDPDVLSVFVERVGSRIRTFGFQHMVVGKLLATSGIRAAGHGWMTGRISKANTEVRLRKARTSYHAGIGARLVIESNSQWWMVCDLVHNVWPRAKIVAIVRDPRSWIRSWLNKGIRYRWYDPAWYLPPGRLTPKKVGDSNWSRSWPDFRPFERLAWEWSLIYGKLALCAQKNDLVEIFRFEDLFQRDDLSSIRRLVSFAAAHDSRQYNFAIPNDFTDKAQNASSGNAADWIDWSSAQARFVEQVCGKLMRQFGYGEEREWKRKISD